MRSPGSLIISAVIPTKNRPGDLVKAVASVVAQTRPPDELLIIDQSASPGSWDEVHAMFGADAPTRLLYVHDPGITGLVEAKRWAVARATGDLICFFEDDVVLEPDYVAQIESGFLGQPHMRGCSGVITNLPSSSASYISIHSLFFRGIFHDPRVQLFSRSNKNSDGLARCDVISGGLSAWRREVFERVDFDTRNGFFMLEDIEFSTRVVRTFGKCLYVNPRARLAHYWSPVNRDAQMTLQRRRLIEAIVYYKKRRGWPGARIGLLLAMLWWLGDALGQSLTFGSPSALIGYFRGVIGGLKKPLVGDTGV